MAMHWAGILFLALAGCYQSTVPGATPSRDAAVPDAGAPDASDASDASTSECPVEVTHQARFVGDYYSGDSHAPLFASLPSGELAIGFSGRDSRNPYLTYVRTSATLNILTAQVPIPTTYYVTALPVVHTGTTYIVHGGVDNPTLTTLSDDAIIDSRGAAPQTGSASWWAPASDGFLATTHSGNVQLAYVDFAGRLLAQAATEAARDVARTPIPRPDGRSHVFAYIRQEDQRAILQEVSSDGVLGPPTAFPGEAEWRVGLAPMRNELWVVRSGPEALIVDRADALTLRLIEEHRLDPVPDARVVASLGGRLIVVSSTLDEDRVVIYDFGPELAIRCETEHRLAGRVARSGGLSFVETEGALVIGGTQETSGRTEGWAARLSVP